MDSPELISLRGSYRLCEDFPLTFGPFCETKFSLAQVHFDDKNFAGYKVGKRIHCKGIEPLSV